jgi:hypothetical protein
VTEGVGRIESSYAVGKLSQGSGELIVFSVIVASLDCVAAHDGCFPVIIVAFVRVEVDLKNMSVSWSFYQTSFQASDALDMSPLTVKRMAYSDGDALQQRRATGGPYLLQELLLMML